MNKIIKFKIKSFKDSTGKLVPMNFNKKIPIKIKRIFFLYGKKKKIRGDHAHKRCSQFFYPALGKFILNIQTPYKKKRILINDKAQQGVLVPPKYWVSIEFCNKNSTLMVGCDQFYDANDYIKDFYEYKKYINRK